MKQSNGTSYGNTYFRLPLLILGIALGVFILSYSTVTNAVSFQSSSINESVIAEAKLNSDNFAETDGFELIAYTPKYRTHHNFIVSYFVREASYERKTHQAEEKGTFYTNLKQFRQTVIKQALGSL